MRRSVVEKALALVGRRSSEDLSAVEEGLTRAARELGLSVEEALTRAVKRDPGVYSVLVPNLTVGETYFFRHPEHFELISEFARSRAIVGRPLGRAWSVGCSTGEEAYSLALALRAHAPALEVLGSDASSRSLGVARRGVYTASSFRGTDPSRWPGLSSSRGQWTVDPSIRRRVTFHELNLATDPAHPPEGFTPVDLIVCRNVLIYFAPELMHRVVAELGSHLSEDGLLLLGALEGPWEAPPGLERLEHESGACAFRRTPPVAATTRTRPAPPTKASQAFLSPRQRSLSALLLPQRERERVQALLAAQDMRGALRELAIFPEDPEALTLSAQLHEELGHLRQAELTWRRVLLVEPGCLEAHLRLALSAARSRDAAELARRTRSLQELLGALSDEEEVRGLKAGYVRTVLAALTLDGASS